MTPKSRLLTLASLAAVVAGPCYIDDAGQWDDNADPRPIPYGQRYRRTADQVDNALDAAEAKRQRKAAKRKAATK